MKSAAYDFLGGIIDSFTNNNSRKSSLALSTWRLWLVYILFYSKSKLKFIAISQVIIYKLILMIFTFINNNI